MGLCPSFWCPIVQMTNLTLGGRVAVATRPNVVVGIPCFNEEHAIGSVALLARRHADEVVVFDDGSLDRTVQVASAAGAKIVRAPKNMGKGHAVRSAFRYAREQGFDVLVLMDGDGQHDPDEIPDLVAPLAEGAADIALGFREGERTQMPAWRRAGKRVLDYATKAGGAKHVTDSQCGYRAFGRRAIEVMADRLTGDGFGIESEQLVHANDAGLSTQNVPISCKYEGLDTSTKGPVAHAIEVLSNIVELVTRRRPLLSIGVPSLLLLLGAVALGIYTLQSYNRLHVFSVGYALVTATLALLGTLGVFSAIMLNVLVLLEKRLGRIGG